MAEELLIEEISATDAEIEEEGVKQLYHKVWEHRLETAWKHFEAAGFEPILIKGWAAAIFYPKPFERQFVDVDLMFDPQQFIEAQAFAAGNSPDVLIDFHKGARHLDELSFANLFENSVFKRCGATLIRVPRDEDHLRILCVHWLNDGGTDRERLWDIYYAVKNRPPDFDWERCLNFVSDKRRRWVICAILLAHRYLDLPIDEIPLNPRDRILPEWLIRTVEDEWASGIRLQPIHTVLKDKKDFRRQIIKRFLPNPVQATIETGGAFDNTPRLIYQSADILKRAYPSLKRICQFYWAEYKNKWKRLK